MLTAICLTVCAAGAQGDPYRLGHGDVVSVKVENRPEVSTKQPVGPDGRITVPIIGSVDVANDTRDEAATKIQKALAPYYTSVAVTVEVETYGANKVLLLGSVRNPGPMTFDAPPMLLEVLSRGGGVARAARSTDPGRELLPGSQGPMPDKCVIYRGADTVLWVDVKKMMTEGSSMAQMRLQRDDVVFVPAAEDKTISIMGQVQRPGNVALEDGANLQQLLAGAGGFTDRAGRNPTIRIVHPATGVSKDISFKDLLTAKATDVVLRPGDVVYVPTSGFNSAAYFLEKVSPVMNAFTTGLIASR